MRGFLVELDNRPDGVTNQSINSYSTMAVALSTYYQRCAVAVTSTQFTSVFLMVMDQEGNVYEQRNIPTLYEPSEPEPETEETPETPTEPITE